MSPSQRSGPSGNQSRLPREPRSALDKSRVNSPGVHPFEQRKKTLQHSRRRRGTTGNVKVDGNDFRDASNDRVAAGETPPVPRAISNRDHPFWIWNRIIGAPPPFAQLFAP